MNRNDFKKLAIMRVKEARILIDSHGYSGAYYLCGYAIECAVKACYAKKIKKHEFPNRNTVNQIYSHVLHDLIKVAELEKKSEDKKKIDKIFATYWTIVNRWSSDSRYKFRREKEVKDLYKAVNDPKHGILKWIKKYW